MVGILVLNASDRIFGYINSSASILVPKFGVHATNGV